MAKNIKTRVLAESNDALFKVIEETFKTQIPSQITKVLNFCEYNHAIVLAKLDDASITTIEENIRNDLCVEILLDGEEMKHYLGRFVKCQQKFKFLDGQRKWFGMIAEYCRRFVGDIAPLPAAATSDNVASIENGESWNQSKSSHIRKPIPALVTEESLTDLKHLLFGWIRSQPSLTNACERNTTFEVIDKSELGNVKLKCPVEDCNQCITVTFTRYPKYHVTKRPRRGGSHTSTPTWYISGVRAHLKKHHKNVTDPDDREDNESDKGNENSIKPNNDDKRNYNNASFGNNSMENDYEEFSGFSGECHETNSDQNVLTQHIQNQSEGFSENGEKLNISNTKNPLKRKTRSVGTEQRHRKCKK